MRRFGKIVVKPNKTNPKYLEASYPTPVEAFDQWPGLPMRQTTTFPLTQDGRDDAAAWLASARKRIEAGVWQPEKIRRKQESEKAMTFAEYVDKWNLHRAKSGDLHEATKRLSERYARILCRTFGDMPISHISHKDIQAYSDSLVGAVTHNERRSRLVYLKQILTAAAKPDVDGHSIIQRSPFDIKIPAFHQSEGSAPATPEELRIIHDAMPEHLRLAITLAIAAGGLRIGEVCGLQRQDIDIERHTISIRRTRLDDIPGIIVGDTKTPGSRRTEPLPESVIPEIEEHLRKWVQDGPEAWIFRDIRDLRAGRGAIPITCSGLRYRFRLARREAGRADLRFHDLRATALTMLAQQGATVRELMAAAGHTTPTMAIHYQRTTEKRRRALADKVASTLDPATASKASERDQEIARLRARLAELEAMGEN